MATLIELKTVYGTEDLENLLEVIEVDGINRGIVAREARKRAKKRGAD